MPAPLRFVVLLTDGFGGRGGIAKFNRDLLGALDATAIVERVIALPRLIFDKEIEAIPESVIYRRNAALGKFAFVRKAMGLALFGGHYDVVICGHVNLLPLAALVAISRRARLALVIHGVEIWSPPKDASSRYATRAIDSVISVSRLSAERFMAWSHVTEDKINILPNSVDLKKFVKSARDPELVRRYGLASRKVLLTLGRLESRERFKGFDQVIDVLPRLRVRFPELVYLIVGDGPDRSRLEKRARDAGLEDVVVFAGYIPESEKASHYNLADVYVMPSVGEGFGIVLIEAAACGVPIVGSNADGSREALLDGRLGRLVSPDDLDEISEAISAALLAGGASGRKKEVETFGVDNFVDRVAHWVSAQSKPDRFPVSHQNRPCQ